MSTRADNTVQEPLPSVLNKCLSIDLEVEVSTARINALAAWRPDTGEQLTTRNGPPDAGGLSRLDRMAQGARFVLGHNLIAFDIPHLQAAHPGLRLLNLPRLDTLLLNPLAFPRRPYHRLVKHYKDGGLLRPDQERPPDRQPAGSRGPGQPIPGAPKGLSRGPHPLALAEQRRPRRGLR